jgi:hypothetical protein
MERIENILHYPTPFLDGPTEFLVKTLAIEFSKVKQFKKIFGENIDNYKRQDYSIRSLPAVRFYNNSQFKESDNGWLTGDVIADVIFPASIRRNELQQVQDTLSAAMFNQFNRDTFFFSIRAGVPGLNELGRTISVDKSLGYQWQDGEEVVPLTQFTINSRLDLRIWNDYLTSQLRTNEDPFERTLGILEEIYVKIQGLQQDTVEVEIDAEININPTCG